MPGAFHAPIQRNGEELPLQPIYLLSDSQILFWRHEGDLFLDSIRARLNAESPKAAYIGASNSDLPEFYELFVGAMESVGITECRAIRASFPDDDAKFLEQADLVLLAGGDASQGWKTFLKTGLNETIVRRYYDGALLIGTSAGAVQLGLYGCTEKSLSNRELFETFQLVPFMIDVHDQASGWTRLKDTLVLLDKKITAIGIPAGGGAIYHPDHTLESIRYPIDTFQLKEDGLTGSVLLPQ
jgi:cyanophycinase